MPERPPASLEEALARSLRHDVGDFLQTVVSSLALLRRYISVSDFTRVEDLLSNVERRAQLCRRALDIVHDFACPFYLDIREFNFVDLVREVLDDVKVPSHLELLFSFSNNPITVLADRHWCWYMVDILVRNSLVAATSRITVNVNPIPINGVYLVVEDDGPGVEAGALATLALGFTTSTEGHGGIALALVRKIVEHHSGVFEAANSLAGGFRVAVSLPSSKTVSESSV